MQKTCVECVISYFGLIITRKVNLYIINKNYKEYPIMYLSIKLYHWKNKAPICVIFLLESIIFCKSLNYGKQTYSGGVPRRENEVNTTSTRCPGPARNKYMHCLECPRELTNSGAWKVPFSGPPGLLTNVWSHSEIKIT